MHINSRFSRLARSLLTLIALTGGAALATGCGDPPPDTEDIAINLCTCDEQADGMTWTAEQRGTCQDLIVAYLDKQNDACLECLDGKVGNSSTASACASADSCTACMDDGE
jgi:hypothetical protein